MSCGVCDSRHPLVCPSCFAASSAGRSADLRAVSEQRDAAQAALSGLVADKEAHQRQQLALLRVAVELRQTRSRAGEAERQLLALRQRAAVASTDLQQRQARLADAQHQLMQLRRQAQAAGGAQRDAQAHACIRSLDALAREQRTKVVRRAMQILPLTLVSPARPASPSSGSHGGSSAAAAAAAAAGVGAGAAAGAGQPGERAAAMICALPLPDSRASMAELAQLSVTLGSALGQLALLLDLLCRFLQLPVPHRCAFQGSSSRLWQPDSFFDMRATPPNDALLLAWPKGAAAEEAGWGGGAAAAAGTSAQQRQRQEQQLRAALHALQRSTGMLVFARLGPDAPLKVPPDWPPFTWLAGLCKLLAAEPRPTSARLPVPGSSSSAAAAAAAAAGPYASPTVAAAAAAASAAAAAAAAAARPLAASTVFGRYSPDSGGMGQSVLFQDSGGGCGGEGEAEEDWEHLPRPAYGMIPPPPSQPEDVEHWVAAMYGDNAGSSGSNGSAGGGGGGAAAAAMQAAAAFGTSPIARLRALTRTYLGALPLGSGGGSSG